MLSYRRAAIPSSVLNGVGFVVMVVSILWKPHRHWLFEVGFLVALTGAGIAIADVSLYVSRVFLPVYQRLERLCFAAGVPCSIRTRRTRWMLRAMVASLLLSGCLVIADGGRHVSMSIAATVLQAAATYGLFRVPASLTDIQNKADVALRELESCAPRKSNRPPSSARFLLLLIPQRHREHLIGDLDEEYATIVLPEYGLRKARLWYWCQVLTSLLPLLGAELKRLVGLVVLWKSVR